MTWHPDAERDEATVTAGRFVPDVPYKGVLHTTQGYRLPDYSAKRSWPHFTLVEEGGTVVIYQHVGMTSASRALRGGFERDGRRWETNRAGAIQIEIATRAEEIDSLSRVMRECLRSLMRWIEEETGMARQAVDRFYGEQAYGVRGPARMTPAEWYEFEGWCGHQHVPNNTHWDPGKIDIEFLMGGGSTRQPASRRGDSSSRRIGPPRPPPPAAPAPSGGTPQQETLRHAVGAGGTNRAGDVRLVQRRLNDRADAGLKVDGLSGPLTIGAIRDFQSGFLRRPDGRVDPDGPTWRRLSGAPLHSGQLDHQR